MELGFTLIDGTVGIKCLFLFLFCGSAVSLIKSLSTLRFFDCFFLACYVHGHDLHRLKSKLDYNMSIKSVGNL